MWQSGFCGGCLPGTNQRGIATDQGRSVKNLLLAVGIGKLHHVEDDKMIIFLNSVPFEALQTNLYKTFLTYHGIKKSSWSMMFEALTGIQAVITDSVISPGSQLHRRAIAGPCTKAPAGLWSFSAAFLCNPVLVVMHKPPPAKLLK